jgi:integrase
LLERHILPRLGPVELGRLDVTTVRAWHSQMLTATGQVTAAKAYRLLRTILNTAVEDSRIIANPCIIRGAGIERTPERPTATVEQVYSVADAIEPRYRVLVLLAAFSGLRFGELAALTRDRIDLKAKTVTVTEAASDMSDGSRIVGPPKTDRGYRTVAIPTQIVTEIRKHLQAFVGPAPDALVFAGPKGAPLRRNNFHLYWKDARETAGLDLLHFHDLRHTGNTLAAATGASTAELMARMGHASPRAALIYQHATPERDQAIAKALGGMISKRSRHVAGTNPKARTKKVS